MVGFQTRCKTFLTHLPGMQLISFFALSLLNGECSGLPSQNIPSQKTPSEKAPAFEKLRKTKANGLDQLKDEFDEL